MSSREAVGKPHERGSASRSKRIVGNVCCQRIAVPPQPYRQSRVGSNGKPQPRRPSNLQHSRKKARPSVSPRRDSIDGPGAGRSARCPGVQIDTTRELSAEENRPSETSQSKWRRRLPDGGKGPRGGGEIPQT